MIRGASTMFVCAALCATAGCSGGSSMNSSPAPTRAPSFTPIATAFIPTATATPRPKKIYVGDDPVDVTIAAIDTGEPARIVERAGFVQVPCARGEADATHPHCGGSAPATTTPRFIAFGCEDMLALTDAVPGILQHLRDQHAASWIVDAVVRGGMPGFTDDGYIVGTQYQQGNSGNVFYVDIRGSVVGVDPACGRHFWSEGQPLDPAHPDAPHLYGPCSRGACNTATPAPR